MRDEEFNKLTIGPLFHPQAKYHINRLVLALKHVVDSCGNIGEAALLQWCDATEEKDKRFARVRMREGPEKDDNRSN